MKIFPFLIFLSFLSTIIIHSKLYSGNRDSDSLLQQGHLVGFIENKGQIYDQSHKANSAVLYLLNRLGMNIQLRKTGFSYDTYIVSAGANIQETRVEIQDSTFNVNNPTFLFHRVDIEFTDANPDVHIKAEEPFSDYFNYYNEVTPEEGATGVHHYKKVTYQNIYPNIDLVFSIEKGKPEYDFVIHPGGRVQDIVMQYKGMDDIKQTSFTELSLSMQHGILTDAIPMSYEQENNKQVAVSYQLKTNDACLPGRQEVRLLAGVYDVNNTLVIDPTPNLQWGTYYGGGGAFDGGYGIATDVNSNVIITGSTNTTGFAPNAFATAGGYQIVYGGNTDDFIAQFNSNGARLWATYYGGGGGEGSFGVVTDLNSNIIITGFTKTTGFAPNAIATANCYQTAFKGLEDAFVAKFNSSGARLWGTYYGGAGSENGWSIATDLSSNIVITGYTTTTGFGPNAIATLGCHQTAYGGGGFDAFVAEFNSNGVRQWGTYYGLSGDDRGYAIATDVSSNIVITGFTDNTGFAPNAIATLDCHQTAYGGGAYDAFIAKFNSSGVRLWGSYYGGNGSENGFGFGIATDVNSNIIITGQTQTIGFAPNAIATADGYQTAIGGFEDAYIAKFNSSGVRLWGTYYGGSGSDYSYGVATDVNSNIVITGWTNTSGSVPNAIATADCSQTAFKGVEDAFVAKFNSSGVRQWGTYYGGSGLEQGRAIAIDAVGNVLITGNTNTSGATSILIATAGSYQSTIGAVGGSDAFIAKFEDQCTLTISPNFTICQGGSTILTVSGAGSYVWTPSVSLSSSTGNSITASPTITTTYTVTGTGPGTCSATVTVIVNSSPILLVTPSSAICNGNLPFVITAGGAVNYIWSPSTGLSSTTGSTTNASPPLGINSYTVTGVDGNGCSNYSGVVITVNGQPTLLVTPNSAMCNGDPPFVIATAGALNYTWSPSTGLSSTTGSTTNASPPLGINSYTVTGVDGNGCSNYAGVVITVNSQPTLLVSPDMSICLGSIATLTCGGANVYTWSPSTGLNTTTGGYVFATLPTGPLTYTITGTYLSTGCSNNKNIKVFVNLLPVISVFPSVGNICLGSKINLTAGALTIANPVSFSWSPTTGINPATGANVTASPGIATAYTVTVIDANGCSDYATAIVNVNFLPVITINPVSPAVCNGINATIIAGGAVNYSWTPSNTISPNIGNPVSADPTVTSSYTVIGTDANGCEGTLTFTIAISSSPVVSASEDVSICSGAITSLSVTGIGAILYTWNPGTNPTTGSPVSASPAGTTVYIVTGIDASGCSGIDSVEVVVYPPVTVDAGMNVTIIKGQSTQLSATAGGISYSWSPNTSLSCNPCSNPIASPAVSTVYTVILTDTNGCSASDTMIVGVKTICSDIFVPDAFSPNGDGQNDMLYMNVQSGCIKFMTLRIYDRWGIKAFESNDPSAGWDGKLKGKECDPAVFVYQLQAELMDGTPVKQKGNITLIK